MSLIKLRDLAAVLIAICFLFVGSLCAQQKAAQKQAEKAEKGGKAAKGETGEQAAKLAMKDLPKVVQSTVQKETQGAEIVGISKESEGGKTIYEIETKVKGHTRDMLIDDKGNLTELEEETSLASLPAAIQAEIKKSVGTAKLVKLETVYNGSKAMTGYSALVETGGKQSEVEMGLDGKKLPAGK
jgi:uncharacterized membrane protein YkoI